jgi:hypothetical protein
MRAFLLRLDVGSLGAVTMRDPSVLKAAEKAVLPLYATSFLLTASHRRMESLELWQDFRDEKLDAAGDALLAANEALTFEGKAPSDGRRWADYAVEDAERDGLSTRCLVHGGYALDL